MDTTDGRRFGAHMLTTGGLHNALLNGRAVGCDFVQIFTKSPQQWKSKPLADADVDRFLATVRETAIPCVASHDSYLINPAATDPEILEKSRVALVEEVQRATRLGIPHVVMHQGAVGTGTEEGAIGRLTETVAQVLAETPGGAGLLLETTAGQGTTLGWRFEQTAAVLAALDTDFGPAGSDRLHICLDTCHIFAAGYDLRTEKAYRSTMAEFDGCIGRSRIRLIHANDSVRELGSRVDRHAHIGRGQIGLAGFRYLLTDPELASVPVILETPKQDPEAPGDMDLVNLAALRAAARGTDAGGNGSYGHPG